MRATEAHRGSPAWAIAALTTVALALAEVPALAIPAPMSGAELLQKCDVAAVVRVLAVTRTGETTDPSTHQSLGIYQGWLQVLSTTKGPAAPTDTLIVTWSDLPRGPVGGWEVEYQPGEVVKTHLTWIASSRVYRTTWWNAKETPSRAPDTAATPKVNGQVVVAGGGRIEPAHGIRPYTLGVSTVPVLLKDIPGAPGPRNGLQITQVNADTPAQRAGLEVGDTIATANSLATISQQALLQAIDRSGGTLRLLVRRGRAPLRYETVDVPLVLPAESGPPRSTLPQDVPAE